MIKTTGMYILRVHAHTSYMACAHPILTRASKPRGPAPSLPTQQPGSLPLTRIPKPLKSTVAEARAQYSGACSACMRLGFIPVPCKSKAPTKQRLSKENLYSRCQEPQAAAWPESAVCSCLVCLPDPSSSGYNQSFSKQSYYVDQSLPGSGDGLCLPRTPYAHLLLLQTDLKVSRA